MDIAIARLAALPDIEALQLQISEGLDHASKFGGPVLPTTRIQRPLVWLTPVANFEAPCSSLL